MMISEQDKQKILNGAYGVSRNGLKCRFIGNTTNKFFIHMFVYFNNDDLIVDKATVTKDFVNDTYFESPTDIVGIWKDKQEPFDIDRALAGEPVKLRDGKKAYMKYIMPPEYKGSYPLRGYIIDPSSASEIESSSWTLDGISSVLIGLHHSDIISMWKEIYSQEELDAKLSKLVDWDDDLSLEAIELAREAALWQDRLVACMK